MKIAICQESDYMGKILIIIGSVLTLVTIAVFYALSIIAIIDADYWWQKLLCILYMIGLPMILIVGGAMICQESETMKISFGKMNKEIKYGMYLIPTIYIDWFWKDIYVNWLNFELEIDLVYKKETVINNDKQRMVIKQNAKYE